MAEDEREMARPFEWETDDHPRKLGRYEILGVLGRGAMGVVYRARDPKIGREVALKTIRTDPDRVSAEQSELSLRFCSEARAAGKIAHPNIVTIFDFDEEEDVSFIAMELLEGIGLDRLIRERGRLPVADALGMMCQICDALHYLHQREILHRDLKPANVMILEGGVAKLMDFGIAKDLSVDITRPGAILGTPHYMSPEQFLGRPLDARSDLFSLGIVLFELLTGRKPFEAPSITALMQRIVWTDPVEPKAIDPTIPARVNAVILKALAKDPSCRYQTAKELGDALRRLLDEDRHRRESERNERNLGAIGVAEARAVTETQAVPDWPRMAEPSAAWTPEGVEPEAAADSVVEEEGRETTVVDAANVDELSILMPPLTTPELGPLSGGGPEGSSGLPTTRPYPEKTTTSKRALRPIHDALIQPPAWMATPERRAGWGALAAAGLVVFVGCVAAFLFLGTSGRRDEHRNERAPRSANASTPFTSARPSTRQVEVTVGGEWVGGYLIVDGGERIRIGSPVFPVLLAPGVHQAQLGREGLEEVVLTEIDLRRDPAARAVDLTRVKLPASRSR